MTFTFASTQRSEPLTVYTDLDLWIYIVQWPWHLYFWAEELIVDELNLIQEDEQETTLDNETVFYKLYQDLIKGKVVIDKNTKGITRMEWLRWLTRGLGWLMWCVAMRCGVTWLDRIRCDAMQSGWVHLAPSGAGWLRLAPVGSGWHRLACMVRLG